MISLDYENIQKFSILEIPGVPELLKYCYLSNIESVFSIVIERCIKEIFASKQRRVSILMISTKLLVLSSKSGLAGRSVETSPEIFNIHKNEKKQIHFLDRSISSKLYYDFVHAAKETHLALDFLKPAGGKLYILSVVIHYVSLYSILRTGAREIFRNSN